MPGIQQDFDKIDFHMSTSANLCNANFIIKGGSCPLEGSTRYRTDVSEDLALKKMIMMRRDASSTLISLCQLLTEEHPEIQR
ncbi:hypothetical protein V6N11_015752 [Hibiscus sabdariffa]|uniref:Uncharacterized protein n=1 Tax=Hibiscus sabdariffa TaxID=183260 RepID=A0ABR2TT01_9ROSI